MPEVIPAGPKPQLSTKPFQAEKDFAAMSSRGIADANNHSRRSWFRSIRTRLALWFSLAFVAVIVLVQLADILGIPFTSHEGRWGERKAEMFRSLSLIADLKQERIAHRLKEFRDDVRLSATSDVMEKTVLALTRTADRIAATACGDEEFRSLLCKEEAFGKLKRYLDFIKQIYGAYADIHVIDAATGRVLVSTDETAVADDLSEQSYFLSALRSDEPYISPITLAAGNPRPIFYLSYAIHEHESDPQTLEDGAGRPVAVLTLEVDTDDIMKPTLHMGDGLGESGEALLVNREGKILTSLKHPLPDGTVPKPLEHEITAEPATYAAGGEEGIMDSRDYGGKAVLAAYRYIPVTPDRGWGLVVKIDKAELFAPLRADLMRTFALGLIGVLVFVGLAAVLAGNLTRPLRALSGTAERVAAGDFSARSPVTTSDEVGLLARMLNAMIEHVENWHTELSDQVQQHTADLCRTNKQLVAEIADRKRAEQEREGLIRELESKNAELERFTYTVSHDLKSPLITIKGYLSLLKKDIPGGDARTVDEDLTIMTHAADRMAQLLADLLDLSRIGRLINPPEEVPLGDLARAAVDLVGGQIEQRGVEVDISSDLPVVFGDRPRLLEVMQNLVDNAVKHMGDQPEPRIEIGARSVNGEMICYVRDNGMGIEPRYHEKIFGLFEKLDNSVEGSGVGLALIKRIVELHGGRIWVESEGMEKGSTFCFTIPPERKGPRGEPEPRRVHVNTK